MSSLPCGWSRRAWAPCPSARPVDVLGEEALQELEGVGPVDQDRAAGAAVDQGGAVGEGPLLAGGVAVVGGTSTPRSRPGGGARRPRQRGDVGITRPPSAGAGPAGSGRRPPRPGWPGPCCGTRGLRRRGRSRPRSRRRPTREAPAGGVDDHRADGDGGVEVAGEVDVADHAGVRAPLDRLEVVDDLHGPHLGRAGHRAGRERRPQHVDRPLPGPQLARDLRRHVHHVAVALQRHQLVDLLGAEAHHPARRRCGPGRPA